MLIRRRLINQHGYCYRNAQFLPACFNMCQISKTIHCLTHVLFVALIRNKEIDHAFVNVTQLMAYFISFSINSASEVVHLINICTYLTTCSVTLLDPTDLFKGYSLALTKYVLSFVEHLKETTRPGLKMALISSFIY